MTLMMNMENSKNHFPWPEPKHEWDFTERSLLEEPQCLSAMPPQLFVVECLTSMKSFVSFKNHSSTQEIQILWVWNGLWKVAITPFQNFFWRKKSHNIRSLPLSTAFWPDSTHRDCDITQRVGAKLSNNATPVWLLSMVLQAYLRPPYRGRNWHTQEHAVQHSPHSSSSQKPQRLLDTTIRRYLHKQGSGSV